MTMPSAAKCRSTTIATTASANTPSLKRQTKPQNENGMARPVENETRSSSDRGDEVGRRQTDEGKRRTNSIVFRSRLGEWDDLRDEVRWWRTKLDRLQIEAGR